MGIVTDHLCSLIESGVSRAGIVVWFDPERHYSDAVSELDLPDTTVACYEGSFFALRQVIEPLMDGGEPPRLVVYVPLAELDAGDALCEAQAAGATLAPREQPLQCNTRLAVVVRYALKDRLGEDALAALAKQIDDGKLSLAEFDALAEKGGTQGVISTIFGADAPDQVALAFLADTGRDEQITARGALDELMVLVDGALGVPEGAEATPAQYRTRVARHVLCTDFVAGLKGDPPSKFDTMALPPPGPARDACVALAQTWRARRDYRSSYVSAADEVAQSLGLGELDVAPRHRRRM